MIKELLQYDVPFSELESSVQEWATEAIELRFGSGEDPQGPLYPLGPEAKVHEQTDFLYRVKKRVERVDLLYSNAIQAKARARRAQESAQFDATKAYEEAMRKNQASRTADFITRDERVADASLDSFEQKRIAHHAGRLVSITSEAYDVIREMHWQLEALRKDVRAMIHAQNFESSLER